MRIGRTKPCPHASPPARTSERSMTAVKTTPFCLTKAGSTRATSYGFGNKAITFEGKTHVVYLDAIAKVKGRTFDHESNTWGEPVDIFEGADNHTSPAITLDRDGHIRLCGGPHSWNVNWNQGRFRWLRSAERNSLAAWENEQNFGYNATYASTSHAPDDFGVVAYRGGENPRSTFFQRQHPTGYHWLSAQEIFRQDIEPQYTHYSANIHCDVNGDLYLGAHFYNTGGGDNAPVGGDRKRMGSAGAAVIRSEDMGATWTDLLGHPLTLPMGYTHDIAVPPYDADIRLSGVLTDSTGRLWALTSSYTGEAMQLSFWTGDNWQSINLSRYLPQGLAALDSVMTIDSRNRIHVAATVLTHERIESPLDGFAFGDPASEIYHWQVEQQGEKIQCNLASEPDDSLANWLPALSQPGVFCPVEKPVLLYTKGLRGQGCAPTDILTEAYCVILDPDQD